MFTTDSYGNVYFAAGISVASIPATTGTQSKVLVPGPNGRISSASISQLITQSGGNLVSSIFGRTGAVTAAVGDYNTDQVTEGQSLYFSASRARKVLSVTTFNTSGPATYDSSTGIINIPQYGSGAASPDNFVPLTRKISINGQTADLSVDRMFSVEEMVYPSAGIPLSNGTSWGASIVNNSANWNTAYSWGNHALAGYLTSYTETDPIWTADKPNYALKTYVDTSISNLIDTAPSTLDTLNELAAALGDDANFSTTITTLIGTKEPAITAGTTSQYWRGDKTWQTLPIYSLPTASATVLGGIKVGSNLSIDANGVLSAGNSYVLPIASPTVLGGIKVGTNLSIDANGVLSSTDTNTTYSNFTRTVSGLVPNPGGSTTNRYLREDGTWVIPPDTDTNTWVANSVNVAGYVAAPGAVANKVWKTDGSGNPAWRDDADTVYSLPIASATVLGGIKVGTNLSIDANGILSSTDTNTWNANSKDVAGYVSAPGAIANKVWKTDASGNPGWRDDADTDTNTTYSAGAGLTLSGTSFSVTKTITASETADTIALRNGSGQLVATGFFQASSRTLKTNITPFTRSALDIIREVAVVSFNYKTDVINKHIGFIAEDTPEELSTRNKNVMDSNNTIGVLLKAIQELESRIKILESN